MPDQPQPPLHSRRIVFRGMTALGVAVALAGCGVSEATPGASSAPKPKAGKVLAKTSEIPVDGGLILADEKLVITQPKAGTFAAFSAVCTHQGFLVTSVDKGLITCSHHGSEYAVATGKVVQGPAPSPLAEVAIQVKNGQVLAA